jgi:hypothetical protein
MKNSYVLVHGAFQGAWRWQELMASLRARPASL